MSTSPTSLSLRELRKQGYTAQVVEKFIFWTKTRQDLFGGIDILSIKEGEPILGVQATSWDNVSTRVKKLKKIPELQLWIKCGYQLQVWGWKLNKSRRYVLRVVEL